MNPTDCPLATWDRATGEDCCGTVSRQLDSGFKSYAAVRARYNRSATREIGDVSDRPVGGGFH